MLLEENLYDENFVRNWTNGTFLVREDNYQMPTGTKLLTVRRLGNLLRLGRAKQRPRKLSRGSSLCSEASRALAFWRPYDDIGRWKSCRMPAGFGELTKLAAQYAPERAEELYPRPPVMFRKAARMFATETPSCYYSWVGLELHSDATQINRAVCTFDALTGQFDQRGSNLLYASTPIQPITGQDLLPKELASRRLGITELPLGSPGHSGRVQAPTLTMPS